VTNARGGSRLSYKFVRPPDRQSVYHADLLSADDRLIVLRAVAQPSKPLILDGEEVLATGHTAIWTLYKGEGFDVGRMYRPDGTWTGYFINIHERVYWEGSDPHTLQPMVDLFLDLWITRDYRCVELDQDEFEAAVVAGYLDRAQQVFARTTVAELIASTQLGVFPPTEAREQL
jgi:predicted RNA-binding protein associated with RNAse of E/G family